MLSVSPLNPHTTAHPTSATMHAPSTPQSPNSHSWKSIFLRRPSSSKKLASNGLSSPPLTLDTRTLSSPPAIGNSRSPITPKTSLTPASVLSAADQRSSYNSSNTQSSESNAAPFPRLRQPSRAPRPNSSYQHHTPADVTKPRIRTKSEKQQTQRGALGRSQQGAVPHTAHVSQSGFSSPRSPPSAHRPISSKSMGALPRFIRRVASAPNAKDLFSPKSRHASTTTKNGLLAPADSVPPVPVMPTSTSSELGTEHGTGSLETASSGSSRGRSLQPARISPAMRSNGKTTEDHGKVAFRRTYSSNSIKVRSVSISLVVVR